MGVQTEVVVASPEEAQVVADTDSPAASWDGFTFNGFDRVQLCTLLSLLKGGGPYAEFERYLDRIEVVNASFGEWPVVSVVPPELIADLATVAALDESEFESLAISWAATEEFVGWSATDVRGLLRELCDMADSASLQGKCIMLWQSL